MTSDKTTDKPAAKSPDQIQSELDSLRADLVKSVDELSTRLDPRNIAKDAVETVKDKTGDAIEAVKDKTGDAIEVVKDKTSEIRSRLVATGKAVKDKLAPDDEDSWAFDEADVPPAEEAVVEPYPIPVVAGVAAAVVAGLAWAVVSVFRKR